MQTRALPRQPEHCDENNRNSLAMLSSAFEIQTCKAGTTTHTHIQVSLHLNYINHDFMLQIMYVTALFPTNKKMKPQTTVLHGTVYSQRKLHVMLYFTSGKKNKF